MNMPISTKPLMTAAVTTSSGASSSDKGINGGFAGVLIQVIDGGAQPLVSTDSLSMPAGLISMLGMQGMDATEGQSEDLLAMIAKLVEQLGQLEQQENGGAIPEETLEQLAAMLVAFQGLIQQLGQNKPNEAPVHSFTMDNSEVVEQVTVPQSTKLVQSLREALQQLSAVLTAGQEHTQGVSTFVNQLKAMLDKLGAQSQPVSNGQAESDSAVQAAAGSNKTAATEQVATVTKEASNQAAAVIQEPRRPVQAIRDPLWRLNLVENVDQTSSEGQPAIVSATVASGEVSDSDSQPAWTLLRNDGASVADPTLAKAPMPAQVPVQQFSQQMEKFLVKQFLLTQGNGTMEAKITLNPEHLGQVDIRIIMQNGLVTAQFMTESGMARDLLDNQLSQLRTALQGQGLQIDRLEVVQQSAETSNTTFMQQNQRHPGNNGNGSNGHGKNGSYEDTALFAAELERNSSLKEFGYGSSLNVTA